MKFTVEVSDFYLEEENLEQGLQDRIRHDVLLQIQQSIKDKVEEQITRKVKLEIESKLSIMITETIDKLIATENIKVSNEDISIQDHVKSLFIKNSGWQTPHDTIKRLAEKFGNELKQRYDLAFATHVVSKLSDNGLLKDDVAKLLIPNS